jgi:tRNA-specific 2-thiouridylase
MKKVVLGMSGGIDSSTAAYFLLQQGFQVEGISFILWEPVGKAEKSCCSLQTSESASRNARYFGIPHCTINLSDAFMKKVIKPFINAYLRGVTPNPCVLCNRHIKFPFLMKEAKERGAEFIATGHYARIESTENGNRKALKKGIDNRKDQSYVLYALKQKILKNLILPLGIHRKSEIKKIAQTLDLPATASIESQEICFIEDRKYFRFIEKLSSSEGKPGPIRHVHRGVIGNHKGIYAYTIGQRKGLGISSPDPLYVVKIDLPKNTLYVGPREAAQKRAFFVEELNWINHQDISLEKDNQGIYFRSTVKVRSTMSDMPASVYFEASPDRSSFSKGKQGCFSAKSVRVVFDEPQWAPAPGQSAVFYHGDIVVGGGEIKKSD